MNEIDHQATAPGGPQAPKRICFLFNAQRHQLLHGISTAVELARRPGVEVHVWSPSEGHVAYAQEAAERLGGAPIVYSVVSPALLRAVCQATGAAVPPKVLSLGLLAQRLNAFDAIALPERTSILLKRLGATAPAYIHLDHGAGDRAAGFDPRIRAFDLVLMAGEKHRERMAREGLIHPGRHAVVGYPKFEAADAIRDPAWRPFANRRPTALYNPHFSDLGSWEAFGEPMLRAFAAQDRYNLIVAPHVRMLDGKARRARWQGLIDTYAAYENIRIDTGSDRCIDMTYTSLADVYVGDVSSQVYEFLRTPRPCVFLDAHGVDWARDENYAHWRFGPVVRSPGLLLEAIDHAVAAHWRFLDTQIQGFDETFATSATPASARAADAITTFLARRARVEWPTGLVREGLRRAATVAVAAGMGWMAHGALAERAGIKPGGPGFVDEAVTSHRTTLIRAAMKSQPEVRQFDPVEIYTATRIRVPRLPPSLTLADVQIYPSDWGPIVQIAAVTARGEPVSLVAMRIDTPAEGKPILETYRGDRVAYWEENGQAYGVVGAIPAKRLLSIAAELAQDTAHRAPSELAESVS